MTMINGVGKLDLEQVSKLIESYNYRSDMVPLVCNTLNEEIEFLRNQLKLVKETLEHIRSMTAIAGYDSGDSAVYELSNEAIQRLEHAKSPGTPEL